jgi:hypothetical protein
MTMQIKPRFLVLLALLACSACADQAPTKRADLVSSTQLSSIRWDEATAASYAAKVSNNGLIMMR